MNKKILLILPSLEKCSGVSSYAINYYRNINKEKIKIDFVIGNNEKSDYFEEIKECGSEIYYIPTMTFKNIFSTMKKVKKFIKENKDNYSIIHCHVINMGAFYLYYAKKYGIKCRMLHSHATKYADKFVNNIRNIILSVFSKYFANEYFACSKLAGELTFKNKDFSVINNAIKVNDFTYNSQIRKKIRDIEKIKEDEILLGNIGRFVPQKNQLYLLELFKILQEKNEKLKLILISSGPLENKIKTKIKDLQLENKVIMKKPINNVNEYLQAMDVFILTSLYEGLPVIGIEAQASNLYCLFADTITNEIKVTDKIDFISLKNKNDWIGKLENIDKNKYERKDLTEVIIKKGYNIETEAKKLEELYINLERKYMENKRAIN